MGKVYTKQRKSVFQFCDRNALEMSDSCVLSEAGKYLRHIHIKIDIDKKR